MNQLYDLDESEYNPVYIEVIDLGNNEKKLQYGSDDFLLAGKHTLELQVSLENYPDVPDIMDTST